MNDRDEEQAYEAEPENIDSGDDDTAPGSAEAADGFESDNDIETHDQRESAETGLPNHTGPPRGIFRSDADGRQLIDGLSGRASVFGFGFEPITEAIQAVAESYLGDASAVEPSQATSELLPQALQEFLGDSPNITADSILLMPSADEAIDRAIGLARARHSDSAFRTIAFVGSDHGRTGMCRTASGRPELTSGYGPMMAGFAHVPAGDLQSVRDSIDEQTCCVLLSPIDFANAAHPVDADFLTGLRELCDQHDVLLIIDETRITLGASGTPFTFASIANVKADMLIVSAGLFAGVSGGLIVANQRATGGAVIEAAGYPLQAAVAAATLREMIAQNLPGSIVDTSHELAVALAESLSEFEFVRDVHAAGMTLGVETDIEADELVEAARSKGLRIEVAGDTAFRLQLPLLTTADQRSALLDTLKQAMESVQRETASLGI